MEESVILTKEQWLSKGKELFGEDMTTWRFVCPGCGHIQSVNDFRQYKDKGATPNSATFECIGRYSNGNSWFNDNLKKIGGPCDYTSYGLICLAPVTVVDGDKTLHCFAFAISD